MSKPGQKNKVLLTKFAVNLDQSLVRSSSQYTTDVQGFNHKAAGLKIVALEQSLRNGSGKSPNISNSFIAHIRCLQTGM